MKEVRETLESWRADGVGVGRAVVVRTFGSAPRPEGAVLLRADDGRIAGSVSGGCVEAAAAGEIERARADGHSRVIRYGISDEQAWDVGLACGGTIDVLVEPEVRDRVVEAARDLDATAVTPLPAELPPSEVGPWQAPAGESPGEPVLVDDRTPAAPAAPGRRRRHRGDPPARGVREGPRLRGRRRRCQAGLRHGRALPGGRRAAGAVAGRGVRAAPPRRERRGRRPLARPEVRRAGDR